MHQSRISVFQTIVFHSKNSSKDLLATKPTRKNFVYFDESYFFAFYFFNIIIDFSEFLPVNKFQTDTKTREVIKFTNTQLL